MHEPYPIRLTWRYKEGEWMIGIIATNFLSHGKRVLVGSGSIKDHPLDIQQTILQAIGSVQ